MVNQFVTDVTSESPDNATDLYNETTTEPGSTTPRPTRDLITPFLEVSHIFCIFPSCNKTSFKDRFPVGRS